MNKPVLLVTTLAASAATAAALAQAPPAASSAPQRSVPRGGANDGLDRNETICRSELMIWPRAPGDRPAVLINGEPADRPSWKVKHRSA